MDLSSIALQDFTNPLQIIWFLFVHGGWVIAAFFLFYGLWRVRLSLAQERYSRSIDYVLLAIDVPREHEQTIKAAENIFSQMAAIQSSGNKWERYWQGKNQETFSLEIVVRGGKIQFLIRTPQPFQDLVEAAVYAQYPDAQISVVDDYTASAPKTFPDAQYDLWGTEFVLARDDVYPIRTYKNFEHTTSKGFADPLAAIIETLSRFRSSEEGWLQLVLIPIQQDWQERSEKVVKKLIGEKVKERPSVIRAIGEPFSREALFAINQVIGGETDRISTTTSTDNGQDKNNLQFMTQGEQDVVLALQEKAAKLGFKVKFRYIYFARKEEFDKAKGVAAVIGTLMQFNTLNLNAFKPGKRTKVGADYLFVNRRIAAKQRKILNAYKRRDKTAGDGEGFILNIEELATIFHFPLLEDVKNLSLARANAKTGEAPAELPVLGGADDEEEIAVMPGAAPPAKAEDAETAYLPKNNNANDQDVAVSVTDGESALAKPSGSKPSGSAPENLPVE